MYGMSELPQHLFSSQTCGAPLRLLCSEVWGGNRGIYRPVELPGLTGVVFSHPCEGGRGGDVHYLSVCDFGRMTRLCVADVVGHGEQVSTVSQEMHGHLRRFMNQPDQRAVLSDLNQRLTEIGLKALTTAAAVTYYAPHATLTVSYAGHPPGWYYESHNDRWVRLLTDASQDKSSQPYDLPLGIDLHVKYSQGDRSVETGDRVLLVTDGILETPDSSGDLFSAERMERVLSEHRRRSCGEIAVTLLQAISAHAGQAILTHDDVTFLLAELNPKS
jgi:sigma-B regulation protein RsbU (phosphoserine phosphatase)